MPRIRTNTDTCALHGDTNKSRKMCSDCNKKQPSFGTESCKPIYCAGCASKRPSEALRDVRSKFCSDCKIKRPSFGTEHGKPIYCAGCAKKRPSEVLRDAVNKMCPDCNEKRPSFGTESGKPIYCAGCASKRPSEALCDVINKVCSDCNEKRPSFGTEPGKPIYCAGCAKKRPSEALCYVVKTPCADCNKKHPSFGTEPGKPIYCAVCASKRPSEALCDVKSKRCSTPHCNTLTSNKAYLGHCYRCYINTYPDNQIVRNHKTKERAVADFVRESYPNYTITFDQRIADGCSRRRPDIFVDMGAYAIVVETDENAHNGYDCSCENKRLMELFVDAGSRPIVMVRFNPDQYYTQRGKSVPSCWGYTKEKGLCIVKPNKTVEWDTRLATLKTTLDMVFSQGPTKEVDVIHLYYDGF